jgi:acyl carrier protein
MSDETKTLLAEYIANKILQEPKRTIKPDEPLFTSGLVDSFHLVDLAMYIEDTFGVFIDDSEFNASSFDSLGELVAFIQSRQQSPG